MLDITLISAISGFCAKLSDEVADRGIKLNPLIALVSSILYGCGLGLLTTYTSLSSIILALAISTLVAGKINHRLHLVGLLVFTIIVVSNPIQLFDYRLFCIFFILSLVDELELKSKGPLNLLLTQRILTPIGAFILFLWSGQYIFLLFILSFDIAYRTADYLLR